MSKVLVVDDDRSIHVTIAGILRKEGYEVDIMENGYKALEAVKKSSYDIALIDIRMPGINGVETFKKLKEISPETTVIMMTAYAVQDLKKEALDEGAYKVIDKPFDMRKMIEVLKKIDSKNIVLVVDDDMNFRKTLKYNLESQGFKTINAEDGSRALKIIKRKLPDVVILDCIMPGMSGSQTLQKMNQIVHKSGKKPEVILVSGYKNNEEIAKALSLGAKKFFEKPINIGELKENIEKTLSGRTEGEKRKTGSVLVVDDETYFRNMLVETLRNAGYFVKEAENGKKAIELGAENECMVILLDVRLPDISGFDVYEKIKTNYPEKKIIMMTGYARDDELIREIEKRGCAYLIKPFGLSDILRVIKNKVK